MDTYEATKIVLSKIQALDPENASRIMGYILINDLGGKEIIRLAFCPEPVLLSYINQVKARSGLTSTSPSSNPPTPLSFPLRPNNPFPQNSPRIMIPNNGFNHLSNPSSPAASFQRTRPNGSGSPSFHFGDEFFTGDHHQLPFLDDPRLDPIMSPGGRSDSLVYPYGEDANAIPSPHARSFHRRSCSVNDAAFVSDLEDGGANGLMWRPCMYFARGFCKNGSNCKFLHSDMGGVEAAIDVGSPSKNVSAGFDEFSRMKALQHQRFALMASLNENMRGDLSPMAFGAASSSARQIYLTFPADSTFKEEDVSSYFGMFGPVQDVRIPYQQKRMFGFVTFVYPETVKQILAKGNPHFVCDSRVLVKPYKEKGKVREKKQHQIERGDYSACLSPSGVDSGEQFDQPFGPRMLLSPQEMMLRRKLEQEAELQHAIELQSRRMMNLQLLDLKNENHNYHYLQRLAGGFPFSSPRQSHLLMNQHLTNSSDCTNQVDSEEFVGTREAADEGKKLHHAIADDSYHHESLEHILPDNLFASPTKSAPEHQTIFSEASAEADDSVPLTITSSEDTADFTTSSPLTIASLKSCYLQMPPRFSTGQEAIESSR